MKKVESGLDQFCPEDDIVRKVRWLFDPSEERKLKRQLQPLEKIEKTVDFYFDFLSFLMLLFIITQFVLFVLDKLSKRNKRNNDLLIKAQEAIDNKDFKA